MPATLQHPAKAARPDGPALIRAAADAGFGLSDRLLETFRSQGLIPRPQRTGYRGRSPVWTYPPGTDRWLACLLGWRTHTKDPGLLKVLLWLDGFPIPVGEVRSVLSDHLAGMIQIMQQAISGQAQRLGLHTGDEAARDQAVKELARVIAARRGKTPIPRRSRVRAQDRADAVALIIRLFGLGEAVAGTGQDGEAVERVLGVAPNGRRHSIAGADPWLTGPAEDLFSTGNMVGLPGLLDAVTSASDSDVEAARQMVVALFRFLPLAARMIDAISGDDNFAGLAGMSQVDHNPEAVLWLLPAVIAMFRAGWNNNLEAITAALQPFPELAARARAILDMPMATIENNLAGQPTAVREQVQRIIHAALDGQFDVQC